MSQRHRLSPSPIIQDSGAGRSIWLAAAEECVQLLLVSSIDESLPIRILAAVEISHTSTYSYIMARKEARVSLETRAR